MEQLTKEKSQNSYRLTMPVQYLKGVGPAKAGIFSKLGVETVGDLLEYFPRDWMFMSAPIKIKQMQAEQVVTVIGQVESTDLHSHRRPAMFEAMLADETGVCRVVWFHGGYLAGQIEPGMVLMVSGKVSVYKHQLQMTNPKHLIIENADVGAEEYFGGGVYSASAKLSSRQIKRIIRPVLDELGGLVDEFYDEKFIRQTNLINRKDAFGWIHLPPDQEKLAKAKRRLKYDELFLMQLGLALRRYKVKHFSLAAPCTCSD